MNVVVKSVAAALFLISHALSASEDSEQINLARPPQLIAFAFDGSHTLAKWRETIAFARLQKAKGRKFAFTYFISGVAFLPESYRGLYQGPKRKPGQSEIDFGGSTGDIEKRIELANLAFHEGNEIGSHANGHFHASQLNWTQADWLQEFRLFSELVFNDFAHVLGREKHWSPEVEPSIIGFRAPFLESTPGMLPALRAAGFKYDTSQVRPAGYWPQKIQGIWNFPLAEIDVAGTAKRTLSMDYNFYYLQSRAKPVLDSSQTRFFEEQMFQSYLLYFTKTYNGNRAPIHIGHHFATFNGDAYNRALYRFADRVCGLSEVECVSYQEMMSRMEQWGEKKLSKFQKKQFLPAETELRFAVPPLEPLSIHSQMGKTNRDIFVWLSGKDAPSCKIRWLVDDTWVDGAHTNRLNLNDIRTIAIQHGKKTVEVRLSLSRNQREVFSQTRTFDLISGVLSDTDLERRAVFGDIAHDSH